MEIGIISILRNADCKNRGIAEKDKVVDNPEDSAPFNLKTVDAANS